jgi:recombination protein RecA
LGQGRDTVKELLLDNPELMEEIENKVKAIIKGGPIAQDESETSKKTKS